METVIRSLSDIPLTEIALSSFTVISCGTARRRTAPWELQTLRNDVGAFNTNGNMIGIVFETATPFETPRRMADLVSWLDDAREIRHLHPLLTVAVFIIVFLEIHLAVPDPWWIADNSFCIVCEDYAGAKADTGLSATKARQAASHPDWIKVNLPELAKAEIVPVIITPCSKAYKDAVLSLKRVRYWAREEFAFGQKTRFRCFAKSGAPSTMPET